MKKREKKEKRKEKGKKRNQTCKKKKTIKPIEVKQTRISSRFCLNKLLNKQL